jgi:hypothetical protein
MTKSAKSVKPVIYPDAHTFFQNLADSRGTTLTKLVQPLYPDKSNPLGYTSHWLYGHGAPSTEMLNRICQLLDLDLSDVSSIYLTNATNATNATNGEANYSLVKRVLALPPPRRSKPPHPPQSQSSLCSLIILPNNTAKISFNLTLPTKEALQLLQHLRDKELIQ